MFQLYLNWRSERLGVIISKVSQLLSEISSSNQLSSNFFPLARGFLCGDFLIWSDFLHAVRDLSTLEDSRAGVVMMDQESLPPSLSVTTTAPLHSPDCQRLLAVRTAGPSL